MRLAQLRAAQTVTPIASVQNEYNLSDRSSEDAPRACEADDMSFLAHYSSQGGLNHFKGRQALTGVGAAHGTTAAAASLASILTRSPAMLPIPGTSVLAHLEENVGAAIVELTEAEVELLVRSTPRARPRSTGSAGVCGASAAACAYACPFREPDRRRAGCGFSPSSHQVACPR